LSLAAPPSAWLWAASSRRLRAAAPRQRLAPALLLSLLLHGLLLTLSFGGSGLGLPGLKLPWQERRAQEPEISLELRQPAPAPPALVSPQPAEEAAPITAQSPQAQRALPPEPAVPAPALPAEPEPLPSEAPALAVLAVERPAAPALVRPLAASAPERLRPLKPLPDLQALAREQALIQSRLDAALQEAQRQRELEEARTAQAARETAARLEAERIEAARTEAARQQQAAQAEAARREAERQQQAQREAQQQEAARQEAVRQEAVLAEAARAEAARVEAARVEAARQEAASQEQARQEAARAEASRAEAARQEADRMGAARQEAARQETARQEAARARAAELAEEEERREARRRAMGRQLDEEAAQREAAARAAPAPDSRPPAWSSLRRARLFGRIDPNAELLRYAEAWARRVQLNTPAEQVRELAKLPHQAPLVTVAIRRDGTVESISFVSSSGQPELDAAIRRIVQGLAPYPAFSAALASEYDVVEIRRSWSFSSAVWLQ